MTVTQSQLGGSWTVNGVGMASRWFKLLDLADLNID